MSNNNWFAASNRKRHFWGIFFVSLVGTVLMGIGCIVGMEVKDCYHDRLNANKKLRDWTWRCWDWQDVLAGGLGALLAIGVHGVVVVLIMVL